MIPTACGPSPPTQTRPYPGPPGPWPCPLAGQHNFQGTRDPTSNCIRNQTPSTNELWNPWGLQPDSRNQLCCQLTDTNPRIWLHLPVGGQCPRVFQMLTPSTSESALALGPPRVLHPLPYNQIPLNSNQPHPHRQGLETNQARGQPNRPHTAHVVSLPRQKASCSPLKGNPRAYSLGDERGVHC